MEAMQDSTYGCLDEMLHPFQENATSAVLYDSKDMAWLFVYVSATVRRHHVYGSYSSRQINSTSADVASL